MDIPAALQRLSFESYRTNLSPQTLKVTLVLCTPYNLEGFVSFIGGNVGLMGEIARTVAEGLGQSSVIGVIPSALQPREVQPSDLCCFRHFLPRPKICISLGW